jgi:hypothetical protein
MNNPNLAANPYMDQMTANMNPAQKEQFNQQYNNLMNNQDMISKIN